MHTRPEANQLRQGIVYAIGLYLSIATIIPDAVFAQRPFRVHDPFYQGETGRRAFYDGYAFTTELSVRSPGSVKDGRQSVGSDYLALSFWLDYQLFPYIDVTAIVDAAGGGTGRNLTVSWLAVKYYRTVENTDYAIRLAVDPSFDGRLGSPQADLAFISTTLLSPMLSSDYAIGVRRVRVGYEQLVPNTDSPSIPPESPFMGDIVYTRALGWEVHFMMQYSVLLNPARSNVFMSLQVDRGQYELLETSLRRAGAGSGNKTREKAAANINGLQDIDASETLTKQYQGGTVWLRSGIEYNRPSLQIVPFLGVPLKQWVPEGEKGTARINVGLRLMLR